MDIRDLLDAGQSILGAVSDAVDTGDYSSLAWDVQDIVFGGQNASSKGGDSTFSSSSADSSRGSTGGSGSSSGRGSSSSRSNSNGSSSGTYDHRSDPAFRTRSGAAPASANARQGNAAPPRRSCFLVNRPDRRKAQLRRLVGLAGGVGFTAASALSVLFFAAAGMVGLQPSPMGLTILFFFLIMAVVCWVTEHKGKKELQLIDRFYQYADCIGTREYVSIEEVSSASGQTSDLVRKDMLTFRDRELVPYLAMDRNQTTVMLTDRIYREYENAEKAREQREEEERAQRERLEAQEKEAAKASRSRRKKNTKSPAEEDQGSSGQKKESPSVTAAESSASKERPTDDASSRTPEEESELDALLREGNEAIRTIREINDRIPDHYEMSNKLYRLEDIMKRIFSRIEKNPACAKDTRRLMNYYLPTTIKLLKAYADLFEQDSSAAGSGNVQETKRQIEDAMDTINDAFETLLDDLFQDQAWDIASDIDVMKTMMAQDGLVD